MTNWVYLMVATYLLKSHIDFAGFMLQPD